MRTIKNRCFRVVIDEKKGIVSGVYNRRDRSNTSYVVPLSKCSGLDLPDTEWFGTLQVRCKTPSGTGWQLINTGLLADTIAARFSRNGLRAELVHRPALEFPFGAFRLVIRQSFALAKSGSLLRWKVVIENPNPYDIEVGELSFPIPFNTSTRGLTVDRIYSECVMIHPFIAGHSSYVLVQRCNGAGPCLLMVPDDNTPIECIAQPAAETFGPLRFAGGGPKRLYVHSSASKDLLGWKKWFHGHSSLVLRGKGTLTCGFHLMWVDGFEEVERQLYELGKMAFRIVPGPVVPQDTTAKLMMRTRRRIRKITAPKTELKKTGKETYSVRCLGRGLRRLTVSYGNGQWAALVINSISPVEELIKSRARFAASKQQVTNHRSDCYGAFMMWDAEEEKMVTDAAAPFIYGGSDELGFADPLFLSAKNVRYPDKKEIAALERYIDRFLFGKLQDKTDYGVVLWFGDETWRHYRGSDRVRSFNYPHVFNIYHSMYLIGKYYGLTKSRSPLEYLQMAYRTARAMYDLKMIAGDAYTLGNMGSSMLLGILGSLQEEEMLRERGELLERIGKSARFLTEREYPYGSEFSYDTTGLETVYFFRKYISKNSKKAVETLNTTLALRHRHPMWCHSGNDVRHCMGNGKLGWRLYDEICFSYMASLHSLCLLDAFAESGNPRLLETGYAGILGCWSLVEADGTAHHLYTHEPDGMAYDPWTGEMGHTLFGSLQGMASYVVDDPDFGIVGYGCDILHTSSRMTIVPKDGLRRKIVDGINRISISVPNGSIDKMTVHSGRRATVDISPVFETQAELIVEAESADDIVFDVGMRAAGPRIRTIPKGSAVIEVAARAGR
jgi:hypothetical protein